MDSLFVQKMARRERKCKRVEAQSREGFWGRYKKEYKEEIG